MTVPLAATPNPSPLSIPAFRRVWIGATISTAGDSASWVALVALAVGPVHASLPLLAVFYTAPVAVGGLCAGWALDRFDRRHLLIADSLVRGAAFASLPLALLFGTHSAVQLYAVAAVHGLLKMTSLAGFPALIPSLVPESRLGQANALEGVSFGLAGLAGAALAGLGVATVGPGPVVAFDVASYLIFAATLWSIRGHFTAPSRKAGGHGLKRTVRRVVSSPVLRSTTIMFALFNVGEGALLVFLPRRSLDLGLSSGGYGYLIAAMTGGELLAGVLLARRPWRRPLRASIVVAQLAAAATVALLVIPSAFTTLATLAALGFLSAPMSAWAQTLRMRAAPPDEHGRLFALLRTTMQATPPLGAGLAVLTAGHGSPLAVLSIALVMGVPVPLLALDLLRTSEEVVEVGTPA
jgi:MFS family permease